MKPSQIAKQHNTTMSEVAKGFGIKQQQLNAIFNVDPNRLERMIKTHQLASSLNVDTKHLQFALEHVCEAAEGTNAAHYFANDEKARTELSRAFVNDFSIRMRQLVNGLLDHDKPEEIEGLLMGMIGGVE